MTDTRHTASGTPVLLMDSITSTTPQHAGQIVVAGSHGGVSSGEFATRQTLGGCFLNDAGIGKDDAGIVALTMLQAQDVPAATVANTSARIGDAEDHWDNGIVSHVNAAAQRHGIRPGMSVKNAAELIPPAQR